MNGKLPSHRRTHHNPILRRLQQRIARGTKPVLHQIMEAELNAKRPSSYKEGELERRGLLKQVANEDLDDSVADRLIWVKHDKHTFRQVITSKGKKYLRQLRYWRMRHLADLFQDRPRNRADLEILNTHRSRVIRILNEKEPYSNIFEAMIPLLEYSLKRAQTQKAIADELVHLPHKRVKLPPRMKQNSGVMAVISARRKSSARTIVELNKKIS